MDAVFLLYHSGYLQIATALQMLASLHARIFPFALSVLRSCFCLLYFSSLPFLFGFRIRFVRRLLHPVFSLWLLCCLLCFGFSCDSSSIYTSIRILRSIVYLIRTYDDLIVLFLSEVYELLNLSGVLLSVLLCFPPDKIRRPYLSTLLLLSLHNPSLGFRY